MRSRPLAITPDSITTAAPLAAYGRFAAVEARRHLHLIDLTNGNAPAGPYAYNHSGQIIFVPMTKLRRLK